MNIYFLHEKNKTPTDKKLVHLASLAKTKKHTITMINDTDTKNPNIRAKRFATTLMGKKDIVLVGGSMGGYSSVWASGIVDVKGMFLLAPALYLEGYETFSLPLKCTNITIVHGHYDKVVPLENSILFAKKHNALLHIISDDHALNSELETLEVLFETFLQSLENQSNKTP